MDVISILQKIDRLINSINSIVYNGVVVYGAQFDVINAHFYGQKRKNQGSPHTARDLREGFE